MSFRLLVFDWDGTLMDSAAHIVTAFRAACGDAGCRIPAADDVRHIIGLGLREAIDAVLPEMDDAGYSRFVDAFRRRFWQPSPHGQTLFDGVRDVLIGLKASGYLLAVATGKGKSGLRRVLEEEGLLEIFDATRCADETASKPDPQMLNEILDELGVDAARSLMIGDTSYDMEMAMRAGMDRLGVTYGAHRKELLLPHEPLGFLDDIRELPGWLALSRQAV